MEPVLAAFVLLAALLHATWNALAKASRERALVFALITGTSSVCGLAAAPFLPLPPAAAWGWLLASVALHNAYFAALLGTYRIGDLSRVYPLARGLAPLGVVAGAAALAGEWPGLVGLAGVGLASLGIGVLALPASGPDRGATELRVTLLGLAVAAIIALYTVVDGTGVRATASAGAGPWPYIVWLHLLDGPPFLAGVAWWYWRRGWPREPASHMRQGIAAGAIAFLAYAIVLYALGASKMGYVAALRETSVVFAALLGTLWLGEPFGRRRVAAAIAVAAGLLAVTIRG